MFKVLVLLALIACAASVPAPSENIEALDKNPVEPATSGVNQEKDDLEGSEFKWGWWPWYYPSKVIYPAPVVYKVAYPAPVVYKVAYPAPVVYKTVVQPAPVVYKTVVQPAPVVYEHEPVVAVPATPIKEVKITVNAHE